MSRHEERLIDLAATFGLLVFAVLMESRSPGLAGAVAYAAIQFWLTKNAKRHDDQEES